MRLASFLSMWLNIVGATFKHGFFYGANASGFYCQRGRWVICIIGKGTRSFNAMRGFA